MSCKEPDIHVDYILTSWNFTYSYDWLHNM